jgi:peptidoglycan/xylan/chitin deacetylase (PgdA/CDA1 family)
MIAGLVLVILLILLARSCFGGTGNATVADTPVPSQAARSWALNQRIARAAEADRKAIDSALAITPVLRSGGRSKPMVALTFDDGPGPHTADVLKILDKYKVKATFFVIGGASDAHASLIQEEVARGHVVANHTVHHAALDTLSRRDQAAEIDGQTEAIEMFGAPRPRLMRPPYNAWNETTLEVLDKRGMLMVLWDVETNDWQLPGSDVIVQRVLDAVQPGSIVLFHDGGGDRSQTVAALPRIIEQLKADGYKLVTIPEMLRQNPPEGNQR